MKAQLVARFLPETTEVVADAELTVDVVVTTGFEAVEATPRPATAAPSAPRDTPSDPPQQGDAASRC